MKVEKRAKIIKDWIENYCRNTSFDPKTLVIGISGGVDSSVVSTLCARTGRKTIVLTMPINQIKSQHDLSLLHANWLKEKFKNVEHHLLDMDKIFQAFSNTLKNLIMNMDLQIQEQDLEWLHCIKLLQLILE